MATKAKNNLVRQVGTLRHLPYPILSDGTADINQGDLVWWDSAAHVVKALDSDAHAAFVAGCAMKSSFLALYTKDGAASKAYESSMEVLIGQICFFNTVAGQTYNHLDKVYYSTDAQTVTATDPGGAHPVGYVILRDGQAAISGGTGVTVDVLVVPQVPVVSL